MPVVALKTAQRVEVLPISSAVDRWVGGAPGAAAGRVTSVVVLPPGMVLPSTAGGGAAGEGCTAGKPGMVAPGATAGRQYSGDKQVGTCERAFRSVKAAWQADTALCALHAGLCAIAAKVPAQPGAHVAR